MELIELQQIVSSIAKRSGELAKNEKSKFVLDWRFHTLRAQRDFLLINPPRNGRVYDIATGCGYLLWFCRKLGCEVAGNDASTSQYNKIRSALGLSECIKHEWVLPYREFDLIGQYDVIASTYITFWKHWSNEQHIWFIKYCGSHLTNNGKLFFVLNGNNAANIDWLYKNFYIDYPATTNPCVVIYKNQISDKFPNIS